MNDVSAPAASCRVSVFKEGLLGAVGHNLELEVRCWSLRWDDSQVEARFDATSLAVLSANGVCWQDALSAKDKQDIEANTRKALKAKTYPEISFDATEVESKGLIVQGRLTLAGVTRPLRLKVERAGGRFSTRTLLHQPDFGLKPFSAMLGALRIRSDVEIFISVPSA